MVIPGLAPFLGSVPLSGRTVTGSATATEARHPTTDCTFQLPCQLLTGARSRLLLAKAVLVGQVRGRSDSIPGFALVLAQHSASILPAVFVIPFWSSASNDPGRRLHTGRRVPQFSGFRHWHTLSTIHRLSMRGPISQQRRPPAILALSSAISHPIPPRPARRKATTSSAAQMSQGEEVTKCR
jgi:hypothetical protein